ncbi:MAG: universal stress protein [Pseudomonadota bacterium]
MQFRSILALTDFSRAGNRAVERAARLAEREDTQLALMHMEADGDSHLHHAEERLALMARRLSRRLQKPVRLVPGSHLSVDDAIRESASADLLVVGFRTGHPVAALLQRTAIDRLPRECGCPVLVVKPEPQTRYRRILVAVDLGPRSRNLVRLAAGFDGEPQIRLFHSVSTREEAILRSAEASTASIEAWREEAALYAQGRMVSLTDSFKARRNRVMTVLGRGDSARQVAVQQEHDGADLVIIGKGTRPLWAALLTGSVSSRIIRQVSSDVMLAA